MNGRMCAIICWLLQSIRCVLMTPFGTAVEPDVSRIFAIVSGVMASCARSTIGIGGVAASASTLRTTSTPAGTAPAILLPKAAPSAAKTRPGVSSCIACFSIAKSRDAVEYAGDTGATVTPTCCAASDSSACWRSLPERMTTGRSSDKPRSSSAWPMRRTAANASP